MNWDAIGAIGEIVGAGAVVVSLVYLAFQIRAQNKEARIAAMHDISAGYRDTLSTVSNREIAGLVDKAIDGYERLTRSESLQLIATVVRFFRVWEEAYLQYEAGRLDQRVWEPMSRQFNGYMSLTPFQHIWELRKQYFDDEFQSFVESGERDEYIVQ